MCAGRRHALGVEDSGCISSRGGKPASKSSAFVNWNSADNETKSEGSTQRRKASSSLGKRGLPNVDDFGLALRSMITLYAILDKLSEVFVVNMGDEVVEQSSALVVKKIEECYQSRNIQELLKVAGVQMDHDRIIEYLQKGMVSA
jgi:hypothetical protein